MGLKRYIAIRDKVQTARETEYAKSLEALTLKALRKKNHLVETSSEEEYKKERSQKRKRDGSLPPSPDATREQKVRTFDLGDLGDGDDDDTDVE